MIKLVLIFLLLMVLVAMIGRALFPSTTRQVRRPAPKFAARCKTCGKFQIGKSACGCKSEV